KLEGPAHITLTFATPITAETHPYLTTQIYFGNRMGGNPSTGELFAITGHDDGTDLPEHVIRTLETKSDQRSAAQKEALWAYCSAHSDEMKPIRIDLANAAERLKSLTEPQSTMVMNIAAKARETFILIVETTHNQPSKSKPAPRQNFRPCPPAPLPIAWAWPNGW
ncbi:MAG: hypothetical protein EBQ59_01580, partial [Verrucomicrobia bacterium]|nr:hypothetical protein [Verrucomicrobiota bacterium]